MSKRARECCQLKDANISGADTAEPLNSLQMSKDMECLFRGGGGREVIRNCNINPLVTYVCEQAMLHEASLWLRFYTLVHVKLFHNQGHVSGIILKRQLQHHMTKAKYQSWANVASRYISNKINLK